MIINKNKCVQITCGSLRGVHVSRIVNDGIRAFLNLFIIFFFTRRFHTNKKHKTHTSEQKQKRQHFYAHKKRLRWGKSLVRLFVSLWAFCAFYAFHAFYAHKKHLGGEKSLICVLCFLCFLCFLYFLCFLCFLCILCFLCVWNLLVKKKKRGLK